MYTYFFNTAQFMILSLIFAALLIAIAFKLTPKNMRKTDGFSMLSLTSFIVLSVVINYGANLAISGDTEHYPAVVVERTELAAENENEKRTVTLVLDDGTTKRINITKQVYDLEKYGVKFVVCQQKNFLGIRMVRLHLPDGTTLSSVLNEQLYRNE